MAQVSLVAVPVVMWRQMTEAEQCHYSQARAAFMQKRHTVMFKLMQDPEKVSDVLPENNAVLDEEEQKFLLEMVHNDTVRENMIAQNTMFQNMMFQNMIASEDMQQIDARAANFDEVIASDNELLDPPESPPTSPAAIAHDVEIFSEEDLKKSCSELVDTLASLFLEQQAIDLANTQRKLDLEAIRLNKMQIHLDNQSQKNLCQMDQDSTPNSKTGKKISWKTGKKIAVKTCDKIVNHRCNSDGDWRSDINRSPASGKSYSGQCDKDSWWRSAVPASV